MRTFLEPACQPEPRRSSVHRSAKHSPSHAAVLAPKGAARALCAEGEHYQQYTLTLAAMLSGWLLLALAFSGCSRTPDSTALVGGDDTHQHRDSPAPSSASTDSLTVAPLDRAAYDAFLLRHAGKVILVDFWATWCPSCLEGFPQTVALHEQYADQGLVVASVAVNEAEEAPQIVEFLQQHAAPFSHFRTAYSGAVNAMDAFEISSGTLPTLKLYDRSGALRHTFGNGKAFDHKQVEVTIRQLLSEAS